MLIINNHASFHLWWKKKIGKTSQKKVSKCYDQDCIFFRQKLTNFTKSSILVTAGVLYPPLELTIQSLLQMFDSLNGLLSEVIHRLLICCHNFCNLLETIKQSCGFDYKHFIHEFS